MSGTTSGANVADGVEDGTPVLDGVAVASLIAGVEPLNIGCVIEGTDTVVLAGLAAVKVVGVAGSRSSGNFVGGDEGRSGIPGGDCAPGTPGNEVISLTAGKLGAGVKGEVASGAIDSADEVASRGETAEG
jgi:hypothetical protein